MVIWLWVLAALVLSKLALGKQRISPEHYIWMLLPIDMYGVNVAGVTLKPYMLFSVFLIWLIWRRRDSRLVLHFDRTWSLAALVLAVLNIGVNIVNTTAMSAVTSSLMVPVVFACAVLYVSAVKPGTLHQVCDVLVATAIGFGLVYLVGIILKRHSTFVEGVCSWDRMEPGIFLMFRNMVNGKFVRASRLRGFMIDPNVLVCNFIYAVPVAIMNLAAKRNRIRSLLCLVLAVESLLASDSRMGMLCGILVVLTTLPIAYSTMTGKRRKWAIGILAVAAVAVMAVGFFTDTFETFFEELFSNHDNRSGLTDEYGRLTLWADAFNVLLEKNPLLGIGLNQVMNFSTTGKSTHNTWLEWICGSGIVLGGAICIYFYAAWLVGALHAKQFRKTSLYTLYCAVLLGVMGTIVALVSVDNVTNSYLWFGTMFLVAMWKRHVPEQDEADGGITNALSGSA